MLEKSSLLHLKNKKNLLAFSAGVDSTALLFLLLENGIKFDIAIVDYGVRAQSKEEVAYAHKLAQKHNFLCHVLTAQKIKTNFEAKAREIRYTFFEELISKYNYDNLLTAHHLGDRLEWMLMQFCKGAGCVELVGMQTIEARTNYKLIRPLLHVDKEELLNYLQNHNILYFEDASNSDEKYKRNGFRNRYAKPLLKEYKEGIKKSFHYLDEDRNSLVKDINIETIDEFAYFKSSKSKRADLFAVDRYIKSLGTLISAHEKELLKINKTVILSRKYVVNQEHGYLFIVPFIDAMNLSKEFKESMRLLKVEPKLRGYLNENAEACKRVEELLTS